MARQLPHRRWAAGLRLMIVDGAVPDDFLAELQVAGLEARAFQRGTDALVDLRRLEPHAVLMSLRVCDVSAVEVVAAIRRHGSQPILLGVGPGDADAAGPVFMAGATAGVTRPYDALEIVTWLARELPRVPADYSLAFGPLRLEPRAHAVYLGEEELERLPLKEFELLRLLMTHADMVVKTEQIQATVWGQGPGPTSNTIAVHVQRLRKRLPEQLEVVIVRGVGYRLTYTPRGRIGSNGSSLERAGSPGSR